MGLPLVEESPCRDCMAGCCRGLPVELSGLDAVRIARALAVPLRDFVELRYGDEPDPQHRILIDAPDGVLHCRLILTRTRSGRVDLPLRCTFLVEVGEVGRCGIAALRPLVCRAYPFRLQGGALATNPMTAFCPENAWRLEDVGDRGALVALLRFKRRQSLIWQRIIAAWNCKTPRTQPGFYDFLVEKYGALDAAWLDEEGASEPSPDEIDAALSADPAAR